MGVIGYDHTALPVANAEAMLAFYRALGFEVIEVTSTDGRPRVATVHFGDSKINLHLPGFWDGPDFPIGKDGQALRAPAAKPGCGDLCFLWDGTVEDAMAAFAAAGASLVEGPVPRRGRRGGLDAEGTSVYTRDPDGNLVEFITYPR